MAKSVPLEVLWEVPLGLLSFGFSRLVRGSLTFISRYYNPTDTQAAAAWQIVNGDFLKGTLKLLWTMSRARWNLHSLIAIGGPFTVKEQLALEVRSLHQSAPSWTAVIYTLKGYRTITSISSLTVDPDQDWVTISLPPDRYLVGLRHYNWSDPVQLPAIQADGALALPAESVAAPPTANQFYRQLSHRRGLLFSCLNYYVYPLLRYGRRLPEAIVKPIFLPVPNPETQFYYGALDRGETLTLQVPPALLQSHRLYFSLYSRDCFPLDWYPIEQSQHTTQPLPERGVYILRVHPQRPGLSLAAIPPIEVTTQARQG